MARAEGRFTSEVTAIHAGRNRVRGTGQASEFPRNGRGRVFRAIVALGVFLYGFGLAFGLSAPGWATTPVSAPLSRAQIEATQIEATQTEATQAEAGQVEATGAASPLPARAVAQCSPQVVWLSGDWGQARFRVEVADTARARNRGLMHRQSLGRGAGMLFVYPTPRPVQFWMKNTLIPLDILFFDVHGRLLRLHENAQPLDEQTIFGGDSVSYVLEINGGVGRALGMTPDNLGAGTDTGGGNSGAGNTDRTGAQTVTLLAHPAIDQTGAVWPCDPGS